jgi:hypothetical protein
VGFRYNTDSSGKYSSVRTIEFAQACVTSWPTDGVFDFNAPNVKFGDTSLSTTVCRAPAGHVVTGLSIRYEPNPTLNSPLQVIELKSYRYDEWQGRWVRGTEARTVCKGTRRAEATPPIGAGGLSVYIGGEGAFGEPAVDPNDEWAMTGLALGVQGSKPTHLSMAEGPLPRHFPFLHFSSAGPVPGMFCIAVDEPRDPDTWADNFLCSNFDYGFRWFSTTPPPRDFGSPPFGCTQIYEESEPAAHGWSDNWLCGGSMFIERTWSQGGPVGGMDGCVNFNEPSDPDTWQDNYLCYRRVWGARP